MAINLYERYLLNEPEVKRELSGLSSGVPVPFDIQMEFDDSDKTFTNIVAAEEIRGKGIKLYRYESLDSPAKTFEAYGIIIDYEFTEAKFIVTVSVSREDPIWQTMFPRKIFETGDWSQSPPNSIIPSKDLGKRYDLPIGKADKIYMIYARADYVNDHYDYLCIGTIAGFRYVYRNKRLVSASEYTTWNGDEGDNPYPGYACIRFTEMQRDPNGNLYDITADIDGLEMGGSSEQRNFARVIQYLLSNSVNGMNEPVNTASFNTAAGQVESLKCDGDIFEEMSLQTIRDYLLKACRGKLERNEAGEWALTIDVYQGTVEASFGDNDGFFNNVINSESYSKTPMDRAMKTYALKYHKDNWTGEYALQNKRTVFTFGEEIEEENPFVREGVTADIITSYVKNRTIYGDKFLSQTLGMEVRKLTDGNVIKDIVPRWNIDSNFQIQSIIRKLAQFNLQLMSYSSDIYQYIAGTIPKDPNPDDQADYQFTPPDAPTGVALDSEGTYQSSDGTTLAYKVIKGTAPAMNFQTMLFGYRKTTETVLPYTWVGGQLSDTPTRLWKGRIDGLVPGISYDFAVMCRNSLNNPGCTDSAFTVLTGQVALGDTVKPAQVTGMIGSGKYKTWHFQWDKNTEADLKEYHVQIGNSGFSTVYFEKYIGGNSVDFTDDARGYGTLYCRVKAVDFTGNESTLWSATASAVTSQTQTDDIGDSQVITLKIPNGAVTEMVADEYASEVELSTSQTTLCSVSITLEEGDECIIIGKFMGALDVSAAYSQVVQALLYEDSTLKDITGFRVPAVGAFSNFSTGLIVIWGISNASAGSRTFYLKAVKANSENAAYASNSKLCALRLRR